MTDIPTDGGFAGDTSRDALRVQFAALRRMSPAQRWAMMDDLTRLVQTMAREGLKRRHPTAGEAELERLFFELSLGKELAGKVIAHRLARPRRLEP